MEGQDDNLLQSSDQVDVSELSTSELSRTPHDNIKHEKISPESLQSESRMGNLSKILDVVEISSDDELQIIDVSKGQSEAPERKKEQNQHCSGRTSPKDTTCSVCLSEYDNKAFLDKCFHAFCYFCILQWSEIVRTCPLCKSSFSSIIHSIKSMDNYQQHYLTKPDYHAPTEQSHNDGRRFRYRTTLTEGHRQQQHVQRRQWEVNASDAWGRQAQRRQQAHLSAQRSSSVISRERRRIIYSSNLWVQSVTQEGRPRQRDISPEFFRVNPACTHRLIPWLTRDLRVLLNDDESHVNFVLQIILSLITKVELSSEEFCHHLQPFLFDKTDHFIHEFISFARSPFGVNAYDERAQYSWPDESREQGRDTPTVFHSHTAGWQTPLPGPSGVSLQELSQTDWNRDSPMPQNEITGWSPSSSPGTTAQHAPRILGTVTISSSSTQSVSIEHSESDEPTNRSSFFKDKRKRRGSARSETTTKDETTEGSRKKHSRRHDKHSHKHKRKHKHSSRHCNKLERDSVNIPGPSRRVSVDSSSSVNIDEIIVVSDSSGSTELSVARCKAAHIDLVRKRSVSRSRSKSKDKRVVQRKYGHRSRSRSGDKEKKQHRSQSPLRSRRDNHSTLKRQRKWKSHDHEGPGSPSLGLTAQRRRKSSAHQLGSRSKHSESRFHKTPHSKRERRCQSHDNHDPSNSESVSSKALVLKKEKRDRRKSRSQSHSPGLLHSQSKGKSYSKTRSKNFEKRKYKSRSTSPSTTQGEGTSSRALLPSSMSSSSNRHSRSPNHTATSPGSRCNSRHRSCSKESTGCSISDTKESDSCSNEVIKREIEDLELRITADKKRLLQLLIKQERKKEDDVTTTSEETESAPCVEKSSQM